MESVILKKNINSEPKSETLGNTIPSAHLHENRTEDLKSKIKSLSLIIDTLLRNAGQGFLFFRRSLKIDDDYSSECEAMFGGSLDNIEFPELVLPENPSRREFLKKTLIELFDEKSESNISLILGLLQKEFILGDKHIDIEYKLVEDPSDSNEKRMMVILTDITDKKILREKMEIERKNLRMVVKATTDHEELLDIIEDFKVFCEDIVPQLLSSDNKLDQIVFELMRRIHTFNGLFAQMEMVTMVDHLHNLETDITDFNDTVDEKTIDELRTFFSNIDMLEWLENDLQMLRDILGDEFLKPNKKLRIDPIRIEDIERKLKSILPPSELQVILPQITKLRYIPFNTYFEAYPDMVKRLAERFDKSINPLHIEGGEFYVDPKKYKPFTKTLVHVFRNSIDHGIESLEERCDKDKEPIGTIRCNIELKQNIIRITISDDGRGIDPDKIRETAIKKGLYNEERANSLSDEEIMLLIFKNEFTTRETANYYSGRGIGLSAVINELEKLDGSVEFKTVINKGTELTFTIPLVDITEKPDLKPLDILNKAIEYSASMFQEEYNFFNIKTEHKIDVENITTEKSISSFIRIGGIVNATLVISLSDQLSKNSSVSLEHFTKSIVSKVNAYYTKFENYLVFEPHYILESADSRFLPNKSSLTSTVIECEKGKICLTLIAPLG